MSSETINPVKDSILTALESFDGTLTLEQLVIAVTPPGECLNCAESKVRRNLAELIKDGAVAVGRVDD